MSVREEDRQRNCSGRGLGIAAAAIGVGVGAALYYFFNKRNETPDAQGATSNWACDDHALYDSFNETDDNSFMDTTTESDDHDTSNTRDSTESRSSETMDTEDSETSDMSSSSQNNSFDSHWSNNFDTDNDNSYMTISEHSTTDTSMNSSTEIISNNDVPELNGTDGHFYSINGIIYDGLQDSGYNISVFSSILNTVSRIASPSRPRVPNRQNEEIQRLANLREQTFRERSWAVEECSICFEPMHREHEVLALPCTHRFHQPCILPWLQERQTCPNCRKDA